MDDPNQGTSTINSKVDDLGLGTNTIDIKVIELEIGIADKDEGANNLDLSISIVDRDRRMDNPGLGTIIADKDRRANNSMATNNKACTSLSALHKALFFLISSSHSKTISIFSLLASSSLYLMSLIK